LFKETSFIKA